MCERLRGDATGGAHGPSGEVSRVLRILLMATQDRYHARRGEGGRQRRVDLS